LADRLIVRNIPPDEKIAGGLLWRSPVQKENITKGEIVALGTLVPEGYEDLKLGMVIQYYSNQAVPMEYLEQKDNKYHQIRFSDATDIL